MRSIATRELRSAVAGPRTRSARPSVSYREPSTDEELEDDDDDPSLSVDDETEPETPRPRRNPRPTQSVRSSKRRRSSPPAFEASPSRTRTPKRRDRKADNARAHKKLETLSVHIDNGPIPPWATLPYQILLRIFQYAATPLYDPHTFLPTSSIGWLLRTARLCHAFTEPALTVLYSSPPLVPMDRAHLLVDLLELPPEVLAFNYRAKVASLQIEVQQTAAYTLPGSGLLDVGALVKHCPQLADLELYHEKDMSPYRSLDATIKWTYPDSLFEALNESIDGAPIRLRNWRWSSRMAGKGRPIEMLREIHLGPSFQSLQKICFINYQTDPARSVDLRHEECLASSLAVLPKLRHLVLESSTLVNSRLLPLLPTGLRQLELINCWEVFADDLAGFLVTHGHHLRSLVLNHNQSLSLSFLPILASACPNLEVLKMNLTYYNIHSSYHDSEPNYDDLLLPGEVPTWPTSLQTIELSHLRKWDLETAGTFFQSILDSAEALPDLRRLTVKAILNIAWRDRSTFRDRWVGTLEKVFQRKSRPPNPTWTSVARKQAETEVAVAKDSESALDHAHEPATTPNTRRSSRFAARAQEDQAPDSPEENRHKRRKSGDDAPSRRSRRLLEAEEERQLARSMSPDEVIPIADDKGMGKVSFIQGMCDVVDIRIDNLRPREEQFTEAQFLDSEPDDDDDWDGTADFTGGGGYAW